jgi:hypothetical protein
MQVVARQAAEGRSKENDREELQSALNRMMEASALWKRERAQLVAACDQLRRQLRDSEAAVAAARERAQGGEASGDPGAAWEQERAQLLAQHDQLRGQLNDSEEGAAIALDRQIAAAVDRVRAELAAENERLRTELTAESERLRAELQRSADGQSELAGERGKLLEELEVTKQLVADTEQGAAIALDRQIATAVQRVKAEWSAAEEDSSQLVQDAVGSVRKEWAAERDRLRQELDAAMHLCARRGSENAELSAERDRLTQAVDEALEAQLVAETERETMANTVQSEIAAAVERLRAKLEAEKEQLRRQDEEDLTELQTELDDAKALLTEAQSAYAVSVIDLKEAERKSADLQEEQNRLRERLEELTDVAAQKELDRLHLQEEYNRTSKILEEATSPTRGSGVTTELVIAEEVRVEELIRDLSLLIDDPGTELSAVIRKTVERAQLDYYLKGLRFFSTGESPSTH